MLPGQTYTILVCTTGCQMCHLSLDCNEGSSDELLEASSGALASERACDNSAGSTDGLTSWCSLPERPHAVTQAQQTGLAGMVYFCIVHSLAKAGYHDYQTTQPFWVRGRLAGHTCQSVMSLACTLTGAKKNRCVLFVCFKGLCPL